MNREAISAAIGAVLFGLVVTHSSTFVWGIWVGRKDAHLEDMVRDRDALVECGENNAFVRVRDGSVVCGVPTAIGSVK